MRPGKVYPPALGQNPRRLGDHRARRRPATRILKAREVLLKAATSGSSLPQGPAPWGVTTGVTSASEFGPLTAR